MAKATKTPNGYRIDEERVERVLWFLTHIVQFKGRWAGHKLELLPWQVEIIRDVFGTVDENGHRLYRTVYVEIPRKNGKSHFAAALALYLLLGEGEQGGEVYGAAWDADQASIIYDIAAEMVRRTPWLDKRLKVIDSRKRIVHYGSSSYYRAIPADVAGSWGFNASGVVFDEFHVQKSRDLYDTLKTSTAAREQPLIVILTTAGDEKHGVCWDIHEYALKVREGTIEDPSFYPVVFGADEDENWKDPKVWRKANPSLGVTFSEDFVRSECEEAQHIPAFEARFRQVYLNQWVSNSGRFISVESWDNGPSGVSPKMLEGMDCFAGLDMASSTDIAAFVLVFPMGEEAVAILPHFWVPEATVEARSKSQGVPYNLWVKKGLITATDGEVIDYASIRQKIENLGQVYSFDEIAYDQWGAIQLSQELTDAGFTMLQFQQGMRSFSPPTKELQRRVMSGKVIHYGNPVLRWMIDNLRVKVDENKNVKPDRKGSKNKIDGVVAMIMALDRSMRHEPKKESVYEKRGVRTV